MTIPPAGELNGNEMLVWFRDPESNTGLEIEGVTPIEVVFAVEGVSVNEDIGSEVPKEAEFVPVGVDTGVALGLG